MLDPARQPPATRRELYARISSAGSERDACRAERLLLRALERQWQQARIERLLSLLLRRVRDGVAATGSSP